DEAEHPGDPVEEGQVEDEQLRDSQGGEGQACGAADRGVPQTVLDQRRSDDEPQHGRRGLTGDDAGVRRIRELPEERPGEDREAAVRTSAVSTMPSTVSRSVGCTR